ncbi:MAG: pyridoxamine 5'-phosphate oxidase family protein [Candidatus Daviesbacteria bacterium]|nr:pyridoxamine 5'-phosphate oxidase family protein [Candidatus Daviesbacteria bacterium]
MNWENALQSGQEIILATSSKNGEPHAIVVISYGILDGKLLIGVCQMKTSLENLQENNLVSMVAKYNEEYYRIEGQVDIQSSGKYFEVVLKISEPPLPVKVLVIAIKEVFDLDKKERII